jgi:hypothetical protein
MIYWMIAADSHSVRSVFGSSIASSGWSEGEGVSATQTLTWSATIWVDISERLLLNNLEAEGVQLVRQAQLFQN